MANVSLDEYFARTLPARLAAGISELEGVRAAFRFVFTGAAARVWRLSLSAAAPPILDQDTAAAADCVITMDSAVFESIINGGCAPEDAFMQGKLALQGDMSLALKLGALFKAEAPADEELPPFTPLPVDTPALVVYLDVFEKNLATMADFARGAGIAVRPHVKSHKTVEIARRQTESGASGFCCAKVGEAEVMAAAGIDHILIANQVVTEPKIRRVIAIAEKTDVTVAVDSVRNVSDLQRLAREAGATLPVLIEINVGMNRCGVPPDESLDELARAVAASPNLRLDGIMGYEGHAVMINDRAVREKTAREAMAVLIRAKDRLTALGLPVRVVSAGGTGTFDITGVHPGVTEIQVGSYIFMDARYRQTGAPFANSLFVIATVTSKPRPDLAIIDAGLKTLSSEFGTPEIRRPAGARLAFLSEEHADVTISGACALEIGDQVEIMPSHCCTTVNLYEKIHAVRDARVEAVWPVAARGKSN